jgi:hypothetical protein
MGQLFQGTDAVLQFLVGRGAQLDRQDLYGRTAYRIAQGHKGSGMSFEERPSTAALLATLGADTNLRVDPRIAEREAGQSRDLIAR